MQYNFDEIVDRRPLNSYKWNVKPNELPMWVADMDFSPAPEIVSALEKRVHQGPFGYNFVPKSFFESYRYWWKKRHRLELDTNWMQFSTGVVPTISSLVRHLTSFDAQVMVLSPVYNIFYHSIRNNGRHIVESRLNYEQGAYTIDWQDLEVKLANDKLEMLIFSNPHNPTGYIWTLEELERLGELCIKYKVIVISDEIHCDLTHNGYHYQPFLGISEKINQQIVMCAAPTKAFNIAGLQTSAVIVPNQKLREKVRFAINTDEIAEPNSFAIQITEAVFKNGENWLDALQDYLDKNHQYLISTIEEKFPEIRVIPSRATYLAWLDCSSITENTSDLCAFIRRETGLILSAGNIFGGNGQHFIRWNYACSNELLKDGVKRFEKAIIKYRKKF